jgi:hypothetical protein
VIRDFGRSRSPARLSEAARLPFNAGCYAELLESMGAFDLEYAALDGTRVLVNADVPTSMM